MRKTRAAGIGLAEAASMPPVDSGLSKFGPFTIKRRSTTLELKRLKQSGASSRSATR